MYIFLYLGGFTMNEFLEKYTKEAKYIIENFNNTEMYHSDFERIDILRGKLMLLSELCENRNTSIELLMLSENLYSLAFTKRFKDAI